MVGFGLVSSGKKRLSDLLDVNISGAASGATLQYDGSEWADVKNNLAGTAAPTAGDDSTKGYVVGSLWFDLSSSPTELYRCMDASVGAAVWLNTSLEVGDLGSMAVQDASSVAITGGTIDGAVIDGGTQDLMNGLTLKGVTLSISSDGTTITASLSSTVGDTISFKFSDGVTEVDTSTPMTATVTAGTDEAPAYNYFYVAKSDPTTLVCASSKPSVERCGIGTAFVPSAATVQSKGVMYLHAAGNEISSSLNQGHIAHISKWIRQQWATWVSGVAPTISGSGTGTIQWASTEGKVFQAHENTFPAFTAGCDMYVVNDPDTAFRRITNFASLLKDSDGDSLTDKYYGLVIWGAMSDDGESKLFVNLPSRSEASAVKVRKDANKGVNYSIPDDFKGVGFLIYRLVLQNVGDTTWTVHSNSSDDIRGYLPNTTAGGDGVIPDLSAPGAIGDVTPDEGTFKPLIVEAKAKYEGADIAGTISASSRTATFSATADYLLCKIGSTLIADPGTGDQTRIVVALLGSDQVTVDIDTTWAGSTAITSVQDPIYQGKDEAGNVDFYVNALGGIGLLGGIGDLQKGISFYDGDSGIYEQSDDVFRIKVGGTSRWGFEDQAFKCMVTGSWQLDTNIASATNPVFTLNNDDDSGQGSAGADQPNIIAGNVEAQRWIEANSIIYTLMGVTQQDSTTDATTNGSTTITKSGENFSTTCQVGDAVLIWSGTTVADYGVYYITAVTDNNNLVLNKAPSGSDSDVDFYVLRGGKIITGETEYVLEGTSGTGKTPFIDKVVYETGLGARRTFGVDKESRTMVICDAGDVDTDLGLSAAGNPALKIFNSGLTASVALDSTDLYGSSAFTVWGTKVYVKHKSDLGDDNAFTVSSNANIEFTDTDGEQSMVYVEPKINQSGTAAYNGIKVNVLETTPGTSIGDGSTGDGNNLLNLQRESVTKMRVDRTGRIVLAESTQPSALADHAFFYAKDIAGTAEAFAADAGAVEAQLTAHNDTLFTPDPNERFPWMPYYANHALGVEVGFDMSLALRDLEAITGHKYIHYNDIPVTIDLVKSRRDQWKAQWIKDNISEVEVTKATALESYDEEVMDKTMQEVEVPLSEVMKKVETVEGEGEEAKTTISYVAKEGYEEREGKYFVTRLAPTQIGEDVTYSLGDDGEVKETKTPKYKMKTIQKKRVKDNIRFDETTGKFFKKTVPSKAKAEVAAKKDYVAKPLPKYLRDRL